ncbi:MAG: hypothetical protein NVSMB13_01400 [Mycobacteriales bacterium]
MLVQLGFYKRKPGISVEEFQRHWREVHGPMLREYPELARHVVRYVQHHLRPSTFPNVFPLEYDGFSEMWHEDEAQYQALRDEPLFQNMVLPDEEHFLDTKATRIAAFDHQIVQVGADLPFPTSDS